MGMQVGGGGPKGRVTPQMNVTPLVDVVLVLLIIFMVVTPLLTKKFWLNVPKKPEKTENEPPPPDSKPLVLTYHKDGTIKINNEAITKDELSVKLPRYMAARGEPVVFFDAEDDADYGEAVQVMDLARGIGATTIAVATEGIIQ